MVKDRQVIKSFDNRILGFIDTERNGDKIVRSHNNKILGRYDKRSNTTRNTTNLILGYGDQTMMLLNHNKR